jgi:hypothetical protein
MPCPNASHLRNGFCEQKRMRGLLSPTLNCPGTASRLYNSARCNLLRPLTFSHGLGTPSTVTQLFKLRNSPKQEPCLERASDKRGACTARPCPIQPTRVEDEEIESRHMNEQVELQTWEAGRAMQLMLRAGLLMTKNRRLGTGGQSRDGEVG